MDTNTGMFHATEGNTNVNHDAPYGMMMSSEGSEGLGRWRQKLRDGALIPDALSCSLHCTSKSAILQREREKERERERGRERE